MRRSAASVLAVLAAAASARAETIDVNSTADLPDADLGDGVCDADLDAPGLQCTLRAAVQHAGTTPESDLVNLPPGRYRLRIRGADEDVGATGDLDVTGDIEIAGGGEAFGVVVDAKAVKDRAFHVTSGTLTLRDVMITGGSAPDRGGGVLVEGAGALVMEDCVVSKCRSADDGAGLTLNSGKNELRRSSVVKNKSKDDSGGLDVGQDGSVAIDGCLFAKNAAKDQGGAMEVSAGSVTAINSTFSGNKAVEGGGAVSVENGGGVELIHVTLAFNKSKTGPGGIVTDGSPDVRLAGSILHRNGRANCGGTVTSEGGNIDSGDTCGFGAGDQVNTDAKLLRLAANGGPTLTHALAPSSPALGASTGIACPGTDQRGTPRGDPCDSGAFEAE
ncbi:MAG: hypothetical protein HMLKMBBP_00605 [Planctomycetes bacterium]|nr:hypothetical protein [Planctomycetota bacterium]